MNKSTAIKQLVSMRKTVEENAAGARKAINDTRKQRDKCTTAQARRYWQNGVDAWWKCLRGAEANAAALTFAIEALRAKP